MVCGHLPCVPPCVVPCASSRWSAPILASALPYVQSPFLVLLCLLLFGRDLLRQKWLKLRRKEPSVW